MHHKPSVIFNLFEMLLILGRISGIIVAGGYTSSYATFDWRAAQLHTSPKIAQKYR